MLFHRFRVAGDSMLPAFKDGDWIVTRLFRRLARGDVVVTRAGGMVVVKRVVDLRGERVVLRGDHAGRQLTVERSRVIGKVWLHGRG